MAMTQEQLIRQEQYRQDQEDTHKWEEREQKPFVKAELPIFYDFTLPDSSVRLYGILASTCRGKEDHKGRRWGWVSQIKLRSCMGGASTNRFNNAIKPLEKAGYVEYILVKNLTKEEHGNIIEDMIAKGYNLETMEDGKKIYILHNHAKLNIDLSKISHKREDLMKLSNAQFKMVASCLGISGFAGYGLKTWSKVWDLPEDDIIRETIIDEMVDKLENLHGVDPEDKDTRKEKVAALNSRRKKKSRNPKVNSKEVSSYPESHPLLPKSESAHFSKKRSAHFSKKGTYKEVLESRENYKQEFPVRIINNNNKNARKNILHILKKKSLTPQQISRLWDLALHVLKEKLDRPAYDTWIKLLEIETITEEGEIIIKTPNEFSQDFVKNNYLDLFRKVLEQITCKEFGITLVTKAEYNQCLTSVQSLREQSVQEQQRMDKQPLEDRGENLITGDDHANPPTGKVCPEPEEIKPTTPEELLQTIKDQAGIQPSKHEEKYIKELASIAMERGMESEAVLETWLILARSGKFTVQDACRIHTFFEDLGVCKPSTASEVRELLELEGPELGLIMHRRLNDHE